MSVALLSNIGSLSAAEDLFDMSLTELLTVEVTTVSKKAEPLVSAPGIVTVVTKKEIQAFGGRHLKDVLLRLPNLYIFDSSTFVSTGVTMRSGATQHLNNRVLYLINGRPIRESQNGGLHTDIHLLMPVEFIERIEMIRGPGSVLYGSNAFSGTINFITAKAASQTKVELTGYSSTESNSGAGVSILKPLGNKDSINFSISQVEDDGNKHEYYDELGNWGEKFSYLSGTNINLTGEYKGFSFNGMLNELDVPIVSGAFQWQNLTNWTFTREYVDLGYGLNINQDWHFSFNSTYNHSSRDIDAGARPASYYESTISLFETQVTGQLSENLSVVSGVSYEKIKGSLENFGGSYSTYRSLVYGQFDYLLNNASKVTVGAQWNKPENTNSKISPRIVFHHQFSQNWTGKALYSEAFRTAYGSEMFFDAGFLQGDSQLLPETIKTFEAQGTYTSSSFYSSMSLFKSVADNGIGRSVINGVVTFVNEGMTVTTKGVELEAGWDITRDWKVKGSVSLQKSDNTEGYENVTFAADKMLKLGLYRQANDLHKFGIWYSYFGEANRPEEILSTVNVYNPDPDSFGLLSVNYESNLGNVFEKPILDGVSLVFYVNNLTDKKVYYPELGRKIVNSMQQDHERSAHVKLRVRF